MEKRITGREGSGRSFAGGIVSLATIVSEHREAIDYDLLTKTGFEVNDIGRSLSWTALGSFLKNIDANSAFMAELHPEHAAWATQSKTNTILADIFDMLAQLNANLVALGAGRPAKKPKPYKRPTTKQPENERHFGRGALPPDELRKWFERKRLENAGSSISDLGSDSGLSGGTAIIN